LLFTILADKIGRRPVLVGSTLFFSVLAILTARATSAEELLVLRFIGGIGMGSVIPNATALIGEYSPRHRRVTLMMTITVAFTAGAAFGGFVAGALIPAFGWRSVFYFGGTVPLVIGVLMFFWLPESLQFLALKGRFEKLGHWLRRIDSTVPDGGETEFVAAEENKEGVPVRYLLAEGRRAFTVLYWIVNFTNLLNLYFLAGLLPTVLSRSGHSTFTAITAGAILQAGGTLGAFGLAWLIARKGFTSILTLSFDVASVSIALIGNPTVMPAAPLLLAIVFVAGWCIVGGQPGLNAMAATFYPTYMRSTGVGWGLGIGRMGAIVGPVVGGQLMTLQWSNQQLFLLFAVPALISTLAMIGLDFTVKP
jgi:AAHS family 4-hydroxybenzoate transporter-like MFS transporter